MLLHLEVENYRSIFRRQNFSMVATAMKGCEDSLLQNAGLPGESILPAAIFYGANASGKTNFVRAIRWLTNLVRNSHTRFDPEGGVARAPFLLSSRAKEMPTMMSVDFIIENVRYHYGFRASDQAFKEEWLYRFPNGRQQVLYERSRPQRIEFGRALKGQNKIISKLMRDNSLFLSVANQNKHPILSKIANYICSFRILDIPIASSTGFIQISGEKIDARVIKVLRELETGIVDYKIRENILSKDEQKFAKSLRNIFQDFFGEDKNVNLEINEAEIEIEMTHTNDEGGETEIKLSAESAGTQRLIVILSAIFDAIDSGGVVILDELDASLHTMAAEAIIELFSNPKINKNGAQLIATTHDTNLMLANCLRRDQIWFVEKDKSGASHIYPLSDMKVRPTDNFERGYLQGRFGAIPFANSPERLMQKLQTIDG